MGVHFGDYDVAVIGAGHAGCEAAFAAARLGFKTVIFGINIDSVANMACNPSIGGTAKGQLVREIDAMGGIMGKAADKTAIQTKLLNKAKGPAVLTSWTYSHKSKRGNLNSRERILPYASLILRL